MTLATVCVPKTGAIHTRRWVAEALLDLVGWTPDRPLETFRIVEPSVGSGAFLQPLVERLLARVSNQSLPWADLLDVVRAVDIDSDQVAVCRQMVRELLVRAGAARGEAEQIAGAWVQRGDYLLDDDERQPADIVVGNPPYIRWDDLGETRSQQYRNACRTIRGRGDIYLGFWEKALESLRPGGRVGFICADRWMRNGYGAGLRELVGNSFHMGAVWAMHDADAFEERVMAYPAITVVSRSPGERTPVVVETNETFGQAGARQAVLFTNSTRESEQGSGWRGYRLDHWYSGKGLWPTGSPETLSQLDQLSGLPTLEETGCRIGIGLATGCDARFVVDNVPPIELDRLLPMVMSSDLTDQVVRWSGHYLVNPWGPDGQLVDLDQYPLLKQWLDVPAVRGRFISRRRLDQWHRTIDKVIPGLTDRPKLLIADLRPRLSPYLETGQAYPHHNLFWITSTSWDLEVLGGLLLSDTAEMFIKAYCVRMAAGTLRLSAQYLRTIRTPAPESLSAEERTGLAKAFRYRDREAASRIAKQVYAV